LSFENANFKPVEAVFISPNPKDLQVRFSSRRLYLKKFLAQLGSPQFVQFYIDKENNLLAIAPCTEENPMAVMVQRAAAKPYIPLPLEVYHAVKPNFNRNGYLWKKAVFELLKIDGEEGQYLLINYSKEAKA